MQKDIFNETTGRFSENDSHKTIKNAKIDAKGTVPRLCVAGKSKELSNKIFSIGRSKSNQLIISDPKVSKYHAIVTFENGCSYIKDTDSANGTYINNVLITTGKKYPLKDGDKIKMGQTVIDFRI